jgi:hypothetical protein
MTPPDACLATRLLDRLDRLAMPLALAIALLLFLQWPLRGLAGAGFGPTQANDLAQWLFALYVAVALRHAGRRGAHLVARPDLAAGRPARWRRAGAALCVLPWALFLVAVSARPVLGSVAALERFPDTFNAGYFMVKIALLLLAVLLALQAALELWQVWPWRRTR